MTYTEVEILDRRDLTAGMISRCGGNDLNTDKGEVGGSSPPRPTIQLTVFMRQQQNGTERGAEPMLILGDNEGLDTSLIVPPLWRSLGVTLWQF